MKFRVLKAGNGMEIAVNVEQVKAVRALPSQGPEGKDTICEVEFLDGSTVDVAEHIFDIVSKLNTIAE